MEAQRLREGYAPDFDIDIERGKQGEMFVCDIIEALKQGGTQVEVKRDDASQKTGNIYVEYECRRGGEYVPSGIATTAAPLFVFVLEQGNVAVAISTERLKELARSAIRRNRIGEERDGSHPTRGALIRLTDLVTAGTKAVRSSLAARYQ